MVVVKHVDFQADVVEGFEAKPLFNVQRVVL